MRKADLISGAALALLAAVMIFVIIPAETFPGDEGEIAPAFLPTVTMAVIALLSLLLIGDRLIRRHAAPDRPPFTKTSLRVFFAMGGGLFAALGAFALFGYIAGGVLTVLGCSLYLGRTNWLALVAVAVLLPAGLYYVVWQMLRVSLP